MCDEKDPGLDGGGDRGALINGESLLEKMGLYSGKKKFIAIIPEVNLHGRSAAVS
jgi:hypothetical protein